MKNKDTVPTTVEKVMRETDYIVSKTDPKGRITYGNRVFIEYSGYSEEELLGSQQNIIRHPDMPRGVFKLLWDVIQRRITSYNVCYTKLLRMFALELFFYLVLILIAAEVFVNALEHLGERLGISDGVTGSIFAAVGTAMPETIVPLLAIFVITSYSIHYTKLYDSFLAMFRCSISGSSNWLPIV